MGIIEILEKQKIMKKILGLDLGTNSIGWALVNEAENDAEKSSITKLGVRIINYDNFVSTETGKESKGPEKDFRSGKGISPNAGRTLKRSMRRNLQRYKLRRENLIEILRENKFISDETILSENGNFTTFETYRLRAKAATEEITLEQFARVLLMINKKRGYKSSRKAKGTEEGVLIDGMEIAKLLYNENLTPGQYSYQQLKNGKKQLSDFYRSDLQAEFEKVFNIQKSFYPTILTPELKEELKGKKRDAVWAICAKAFKEKGTELVGTKRQGTTAEQKIENFLWRTKGLSEKLNLEQIVVVLQQINTQLNSSSGYLGAISDRSKELFFNQIKKADGSSRAQTVGEYQMDVLDKNPNASLRNMVFYRQDYLDEFNTIWEQQAEFHKELTAELKQEIRDVVIFYQRPLKSQKGLISFCEFESRKIEVEIDGKKKTKTIGSRVIPRSSPLFQEFKIWQKLNDIEVFPANEKKKKYKPNASRLNPEQKELLFKELSVKEKMTKIQILSLLDLQEFDMNFNLIDGNKTQSELIKSYNKIIERSEKEISLKDFQGNNIESIAKVFNELGYKSDMLYFDSDVENLDDEPFYMLWHLLYSFEGDKTNTGNEALINKLMSEYNFDKAAASILAGVTFQYDYGSLSAKAIRKILPRMKQGEDYTTACAYVYGKHSKNSLTKEEIEQKVYKDKLETLPKNSLRNPVVEKILNQMVNVVNAIIDDPQLGKPDEIRIELARELKKSADERILLSENVKGNTDDIERIKNLLKEDFPIFKTAEPSRNDIIRYKLWEELAPNGHKPLYGSKENLQKEISPSILFTKNIQIEHIIPKARLFDDSFSNKTLIFSSDNTDKGVRTAIDYMNQDFNDDLSDYIKRIISVFGTKTIKRVNKLSKKIETKTETFEVIFKEHEKNLRNNKKQKEKSAKWDSLSEEEKKKQKKPWDRMSDTEKKLEVIEKYYSGKLGKLAMSEKDLPEGFINRDLANTQYITKEAKKMLGDLVKYVVCTTGSITDRLREDWQLVDVMKEINFLKYEQLGLIENVEHVDYETGEIRYDKKIKDWTKRNDHRHHAMDALTVAFTKRQFIQYLNNLNARRLSEKQGISNAEKEEQDNFAITSEDIILNTRDVLGIEKKELYRDKRNKLRFIPPIPIKEFRAETKRHLENTLISIKAKNKVVTQNINKAKNHITFEKILPNGETKIVKGQKCQTLRGQLHDQTIYGSNPWSRILLSSKITKIEIENISSSKLKEFIKEHIRQKGSITKAFSEEELKTLKYNGKALIEVEINSPCYTQRIDIGKIFTDAQKTNSAKEKILANVLDLQVRKVLQNRLDEFNGDFKKAFSNLEANPILNKNGKFIKRVIIQGISNAEALHDKRDKEGNVILDKNGKKQPVDFVQTGNNHHVAIYRDADGNLQEKVVSFFEAITRVNQGLPVIDKEFKRSDGWVFLFSMKQNEYFVFPKTEIHEKVNEKTGEITCEKISVFNPNEIDLLNPDNYFLISPNLFRVQKIGQKDYWFRHHLETKIEDNSKLSEITFKRKRNPKSIENIVKVRIDHIGQIVSVGEY